MFVLVVFSSHGGIVFRSGGSTAEWPEFNIIYLWLTSNFITNKQGRFICRPYQCVKYFKIKSQVSMSIPMCNMSYYHFVKNALNILHKKMCQFSYWSKYLFYSLCIERLASYEWSLHTELCSTCIRVPTTLHNTYWDNKPHADLFEQTTVRHVHVRSTCTSVTCISTRIIVLGQDIFLICIMIIINIV